MFSHTDDPELDFDHLNLDDRDLAGGDEEEEEEERLYHPSPGSEGGDGDDQVDGGDCLGREGCLAITLAALGVLGNTKEQVVVILDKHIDPHLQELEEQREPKGQPPPQRTTAGQEGSFWAAGVVKRALVDKYGNMGNFTFRKVNLSDPGWRDRNKSYIVDGELNREYTHVSASTTARNRPGQHARCQHTDWAVPGGSWRHSIAIRGNKFFCRGVGDRWVQDWSLWLDRGTGRPITDKGYLKLFFKVYEIEVTP